MARKVTLRQLITAQVEIAKEDVKRYDKHSDEAKRAMFGAPNEQVRHEQQWLAGYWYGQALQARNHVGLLKTFLRQTETKAARKKRLAAAMASLTEEG